MIQHSPILDSSASQGKTDSHRRRRSLANPISPTSPRLEAPASPRFETFAETSGSSSDHFGHHLAPLPDADEPNSMSLSRSPSPQRGGGWATPGLTTPYDGSSRRSSPIRTYPNGNPAAVTWASASARSAQIRASPSFAPRSNGIVRHLRRFSAKLPFFNSARNYAEKEKLGRGRNMASRTGRFRDYAARIGRRLWKFRLFLAAILAFCSFFVLFYATPLHRVYRRHLAGGKKHVIILAANQGGGVMEWKGPREWAIERDSVRNKRQYAKRWGYDLEIVDMSTKKRYAHEWRESWEKVDMIKNTMRKYPHAEWFWWLDLNTFIMEPSYSLQRHVLSDLKSNTYRDINVYNPLNISHPPTEEFLDPETLSPVGDNKPESINIIIPQDCGGFNLGSFFIRRCPWTDRLLDMWWDPVGYEQKHMEWEHKEQDALEYMYRNQPWIRPHLAFIPQRKINSFPPGACGDQGDDAKIHYKSLDRDFLVNMAGCEWGRDCWGEMYNYRQLSNHLNRNPWEKFKDWVSDTVKGMFRKKEKKDKEHEKEGKEE